MSYRLIVGLAVGGLVLGGCGGGPKAVTDKPIPLPKPPPAVPPAQSVALDPTLRAVAQGELERALKATDAFTRAHAVEGLREGMGGEAREQILTALYDAAEPVRFAAALAAGQLGLSGARPRLLQLSTDPSKHVRIAARFALHKLGDRRLSHDLETTAQDADPGVRANTVMVLGMLGEKSALKILRPMIADPSPAVRLQVAEAMWMLGDEQGLKSLVSWSLSGYPDDQLVAALALAKPRETRVREHVRGLLTTAYAEVNLQAARGMGMLGSDDGYGVAIQGAQSTDWRQRHLAALAMGSIGRPDAQQALGTLLKDPNPEVRLAAATAVLQLNQRR